jgi:hypothetical protein
MSEHNEAPYTEIKTKGKQKYYLAVYTVNDFIEPALCRSADRKLSIWIEYSVRGSPSSL